MTTVGRRETVMAPNAATAAMNSSKPSINDRSNSECGPYGAQGYRKA